MKIKNYILLTSFFLIGSQVINPQSKTGNLPVIDLSKTYPKKDKLLRDMADIEYIPLETTDDVLLSDKTRLSYVSDKYIFINELDRGDMYVFNRSGKIYSHFNHKGQSGREYIMLGADGRGVVFDEKNEEIFVCSYPNSIQVYSLSGEYKRTLKIKLEYHSKVFNFDDETLLFYDEYHLDRDINSKPNTKPYSLISKKDGSLISVLDIYLPERSSTYVTQTIEKDKSGQEKMSCSILSFPFNMYYGQDFMIADISSDTLYLLTQNKELTPLLTRKPSSHASDPKIIWAHLLTTDKYIFLSRFPLVFSRGGGTQMTILVYEIDTGEISDLSILDYDVESIRVRWGPLSSPAIAKNMTAQLIWPSSIIDAYKEKKLQGDVEKLAKTLDEDDNPLVRIIKFK